MEALSLAIAAMREAEEALGKQGITLRWKVRVKAGNHSICPCVKGRENDSGDGEKNPGEIKQVEPEEAKASAGEVSTDEGACSIPVAAREAEQSAAGEPEVRPITSFDTKEAAEYLGISVPGVYDLVRRGRIPAHGEMGQRWYKSEELDLYLASR